VPPSTAPGGNGPRGVLAINRAEKRGSRPGPGPRRHETVAGVGSVTGRRRRGRRVTGGVITGAIPASVIATARINIGGDVARTVSVTADTLSVFIISITLIVYVKLTYAVLFVVMIIDVCKLYILKAVVILSIMFVKIFA